MLFGQYDYRLQVWHTTGHAGLKVLRFSQHAKMQLFFLSLGFILDLEKENKMKISLTKVSFV